MTPERWARIAPLIDAALDLDGKDRTAFIERACGADSTLRADLTRLLEEAERGDSLIDNAAAERFALLLDENPEALPGVLNDRYIVDRELGRGGMATVFLAHDRKHERPVAIKVLRQDVAARIGSELFAREISIAARLQHPHIVPVHDSGEADGFLYYVMAYSPGETLRERLKRDPQLPLGEAQRITREIANALDYAHKSGVVHRDIKPENILLSDDHALVLDFGIARAVSEIAGGDKVALPGVAGTPAYMSPEQARADDSIDGRADVYALGCVAYEMVAGRPPFPATTRSEIIRRHSVDPVPSIRTSRPDLPDYADRAIQRALAKSRDDRFASAGEFSSTFAGAAPDGRRASQRRLLRPAAMMAAAAVVVLIVQLIRSQVSHAGQQPGLASNEPESIAVLPFRSIGNDSASEAMSDGISEEIAATIGNIPGLMVRSPRSSFSFKGKKLTTQEIGAALSVRYLVDGSLQHEGDRLRARVSLLSARNDSTLWTRFYNRPFRDVFAMQDEIARDIAGKLRIHLGAASIPNLSRRSTASAQAHELYLRGRFFFQRRDSASLRKATEYFSQAVAADPNYTLAYTGLSDAYSHSSVFGYVAPHTNMPRARTYVDRALALDTMLAEAHASRAFVATFYEWDWGTAAREFDRALAIDPEYPSAHLWKAWYLIAKDSADASIAEGQLALSMEPFLVLTNTRLISLLYYGKRYDEALGQAQKTYELDSTFFQLSTERARVLVELGRCTEALQALEHTPPQTPAMLSGTRGYIAAKCGRRSQAMAELNRLRAEARSGKYISHYALAVIQAGLGNKDEAFTELDRAIAEHSWCMFLVKVEPAFDSLQHDPRFAEIVHRLRLGASGRQSI